MNVDEPLTDSYVWKQWGQNIHSVRLQAVVLTPAFDDALTFQVFPKISTDIPRYMQRFMIYVFSYLYIKTCPLHGGLKFDGVYIEYAYIYRNTLQWIYTGNKHNIIDMSQHIYLYIYI